MNEINLQNYVKKAKTGDQEAQSFLIEHFQKRLFQFCYFLVHRREVAEDLCQDAFIKAFQSLPQLKNENAFQTWLFQIAKNLFLDFKKSAAQTETPVEEPLEGEITEPGMEQVFLVRKVLSHFETEDRLLLLLVELEGNSYKEAGEIVGVSEDTVRSRLHRLKTEFLKILKKVETNEGARSSTSMKGEKS
jgi:RNA polymerase sigma-70 factor (ECF subfamily)